MSLTVFLAMCVLGVDFLIYFFFKLLYGEKRRISPRRLPPDYYKRKEKTSSLYLVPARKNRLPGPGPVVSRPESTKLRGEPPRELRKESRRTPPTSIAENLAYRRITAAFAQSAQSKSRT